MAPRNILAARHDSPTTVPSATTRSDGVRLGLGKLFARTENRCGGEQSRKWKQLRTATIRQLRPLLGGVRATDPIPRIP